MTGTTTRVKTKRNFLAMTPQRTREWDEGDDGRVRVIDFGLARASDLGMSSKEAEESFLSILEKLKVPVMPNTCLFAPIPMCIFWRRSVMKSFNAMRWPMRVSKKP